MTISQFRLQYTSTNGKPVDRIVPLLLAAILIYGDETTDDDMVEFACIASLDVGATYESNDSRGWLCVTRVR